MVSALLFAKVDVLPENGGVSEPNRRGDECGFMGVAIARCRLQQAKASALEVQRMMNHRLQFLVKRARGAQAGNERGMALTECLIAACCSCVVDNPLWR